ncbi:ATP-binding protein, partial [Candidatus Frankia nodulisporulans]
MEIKLSLSLPRDEISIPVVRRICTQSLKVLGVIRECIDDVELALTEACANVLIHAQIEDEYEVSVGVDNEVAVIEVSDRGGGFDLTVDPDLIASAVAAEAAPESAPSSTPDGL